MNYLKKRFKSDSGDAIFITILISMILILTVAGLVIDLGKNVVLKNNYTSIAQTSAQTAVKDINARGSLTPTSYSTFIKEYYSNAHGVSPATKIDMGGCEITVPGVNGGKPFTYKGPYFKVALAKERGIGAKTTTLNPIGITYVQGTGQEVINKIGQLQNKIKESPVQSTYRVLETEITEVAPNFVLGMVGMGCQQFTVRTSAVAFGSQQDLQGVEDENKEPPTITFPTPFTTFEVMFKDFTQGITIAEQATGFDLVILNAEAYNLDYTQAPMIEIILSGTLPGGQMNIQYYYVSQKTGEKSDTITVTIQQKW